MASVTDWFAFVGLDYHDCFVQVCVLDQEGNVLLNRRVGNDSGLIFDVVDRACDGRLVKSAAVEACCGSSHFAEDLNRLGWNVVLAHAGTCSKMKQNPDKSDFSDAQLLADLCRVGYVPRVWLPPAEIRDLRRLGRYRQQLVDQRRNVKLRIRAMLREERVKPPAGSGNAWTVGWLDWLAKSDQLRQHGRWVVDQHLKHLKQLVAEIRIVEKRMEDVTRNDPIVQALREMKGVGLVTAVVMRAEIGSFERFSSGKQLARYCAVTPRNASSGKRQADGGLIRAGSLSLRTLIIEAAHRLSRYHPQWKVMKDNLKARGKHGSVATAAVANRWVRKLYWQMKAVGLEQAA